MAFYTNRHGQLTSTYGLVGDNNEEKEKDERKAEMMREEGERQSTLQKELAKQQAETQRYSSDAGMRLYREKRGDTPPWPNPGYNKGGPVIKGEFKHANPTYTKFGQTADSNLLAKGRK